MSQNKLTRRDFLKIAGATTAGLAISACGIDATKLTDPTAIPSLTPSSTPSLTPYPTITNTPTLSPTPKPLPTLGELGRKLGLDVGISLRIVDKFYDSNYQKFLLNFSMLTDGWAANPVWWTDANKARVLEYWNTLSSFAKTNNISLDMNHLFWAGYFGKSSTPININNLLSASKDEVETWMHERAKTFFTIPYLTSVNFANEVFYNHPETFKHSWNSSNNPFYRTWGESWPFEAYKVAWYEAMNMGKAVGKDFRLVYNSASLEVDTPGGRIELKYLSDLKNKLNKELGIERPFDIGMQFHTRTEPIKKGECYGWNVAKLDKKTLTDRFKQIGDIGDIRVTEFSIANTEDAQAQKDVLHTVVEALIESGVGKSFIMWSPQEQFDTNPERVNLSCSIRNIMDASYKPMFMFDELYKILQSRS
jgi:hypothetical protein